MGALTRRPSRVRRVGEVEEMSTIQMFINFAFGTSIGYLLAQHLVDRQMLKMHDEQTKMLLNLLERVKLTEINNERRTNTTTDR